MVQENDGDIFYISDILWNYETGLNKWNRILEEERNMHRLFPLYQFELEQKAEDKGEDSRTLITDNQYYDYWINREDGSYFRLQIELIEPEDNLWYIDCGYKFTTN